MGGNVSYNTDATIINASCAFESMNSDTVRTNNKMTGNDHKVMNINVLIAVVDEHGLNDKTE